MTVIESFRDQLDIKLTEVVERNNKNSGKSDIEFLADLHKSQYINDITPMQPTNRGEFRWKTLRWTQGSNFCFTRGHLIYDNPLAYGNWSDYLRVASKMFQIDESTPADSAIGDPGRVRFVEYRPNAIRTAVFPAGIGVLTQVDFVELLKSGRASYRLTSGYTFDEKYIEGVDE